jgi:hypothetical protein
VSSILPIALFVLAGILVGGAVSTRRQGGPRNAVIVLAGLGVLALAAGALRLYSGKG